MVALDTSTLVAYIGGATGPDVDALLAALPSGNVALPPVVLSEALSEPSLPPNLRAVILGLPILDAREGYWIRAAEARSKLLARRLRARLPDALIAQSCLDHDLPLITRDRDFRHFVEHCGLRLA
jgi:predicted nucleic acid-binding protein